jgi:hypothetical protein
MSEPSTSPSKPTGPRRQAVVEPGIRRLLLILVVATVIGAIMTLVGELMLRDEAIKNAGFTLAMTGAGFYFLVRFLGKMRARQARDQMERREQLRRDAGDGDQS